MDEAGVKNGFFTVKMGNKEFTHYYSEDKVSGAIQSKKRYDMHYKSLTEKFGLLTDHTPGEIFKIKDKEYILTKDYTLDIPYGEDIYNTAYPKGKKMNKTYCIHLKLVYVVCS